MNFVIGKYYNVPCLIKPTIIETLEWEQDEQELWMDTKPIYTIKKILNYTPIINHPHNDVENGQKEIHFHADNRFMSGLIFNGLYTVSYNTRLTLEKEDYIVNLRLKYSGLEIRKTPVELIKNSTLKHKCIHKGKCPHRGYDLSNEVPIDGIITCPLHGLKFNSQTKQLIEK